MLLIDDAVVVTEARDGCKFPVIRGCLAEFAVPAKRDRRLRRCVQAKAQETISKTLTADYLRFKLYDSQNSKFVLLPDKLNVPILINPGTDKPAQITHEPDAHLEDDRSRR